METFTYDKVAGEKLEEELAKRKEKYKNKTFLKTILKIIVVLGIPFFFTYITGNHGLDMVWLNLFFSIVLFLAMVPAASMFATFVIKQLIIKDISNRIKFLEVVKTMPVDFTYNDLPHRDHNINSKQQLDYLYKNNIITVKNDEIKLSKNEVGNFLNEQKKIKASYWLAKAWRSYSLIYVMVVIPAFIYLFVSNGNHDGVYQLIFWMVIFYGVIELFFKPKKDTNYYDATRNVEISEKLLKENLLDGNFSVYNIAKNTYFSVTDIKQYKNDLENSEYE